MGFQQALAFSNKSFPLDGIVGPLTWPPLVDEAYGAEGVLAGSAARLRRPPQIGESGRFRANESARVEDRSLLGCHSVPVAGTAGSASKGSALAAGCGPAGVACETARPDVSQHSSLHPNARRREPALVPPPGTRWNE